MKQPAYTNPGTLPEAEPAMAKMKPVNMPPSKHMMKMLRFLTRSEYQHRDTVNIAAHTYTGMVRRLACWPVYPS